MNSNYSSQGYPPQGGKMEIKKPDGLCMAGCIVSLVCSGLAMLGLFISAIVFLLGQHLLIKLLIQDHNQILILTSLDQPELEWEFS
ncbi:hypothetical protein SERIO_v1c00250 [Spiroplasma eriocheiris]|uniref:Transmembrane protein n=1 Tax=Spiroplasma eriocheiris TaxID=315358 RepID=A0A0H3XGP2_9MOLU|nr:hypothetical protein SERIO_v1c00250 [Spiroplasma eriocheiris]